MKRNAGALVLVAALGGCMATEGTIGGCQSPGAVPAVRRGAAAADCAGGADRPGAAAADGPALCHAAAGQ